MAANTLTLYNAVGILTDLLDSTTQAALCDNCGDELGDTTWNICTGPLAPEGTLGIPEHHSGHTACTTCAMDPLSYIAEGGACRPCLTTLGGRRSSVIKAGVALRPPVKNVLANKMISYCTTAQHQVNGAQEAQDAERRQDGVDRRIAAVEDVRRRRAEAEAEAARLRAEAEQVHAEANRVKERAEKDARNAKEKTKEDTRVAQEKIEKDARDADEKILEVQRAAQAKIDEDHRTAQKLMQEEAVAFTARLTRDATTDNPSPNATMRKRKDPPSQDVIDRRKEAARATREEKKRKLEQYDFLVAQNEILSRQIVRVQEVARDWVMKSCPEGEAETITESMANEMQDEMDKIERDEDDEGVEEDEEEGECVD
tara:strand:- start:5801 stop:6913 length:1113 start_codon:yes stop_codon:yes gene_type:complete